MKINFIRQISDDILKQNHELRTSIILAKQHLQNYEDNMISFIRDSQIQTPILGTPHQTLTLFIKTVHSRIADYQLQLKRQEVSSKQLAQLSHDLQLKDRQIKKERQQASNRENKWKQEFDSIQKRYYEMQKKLSFFQSNQYSLKQEIRSVTQKSAIEKNIQEQLKRKEIEGVKLACNNQLLQLRDRIESQNLLQEKKYLNQLAEKDKRIKELERLIEKLSTNIKLDSKDTTIMSTVLQAFQQSGKSRKTIDDLKNENLTIKKALSEIEKAKLQLQSIIMQRNISLHNLQSQLERQKIDKLQFQRSLRTKIKEHEKAEKDRQAMVQYYQNKWNSDFKKVKSHVDKAFMQKSQELEAAYAIRMKQFQGKMAQWQERINGYQLKNRELEKIHNLDRKETQKLRKDIELLLKQRQQIKQQLIETWRMSRQQLSAQKIASLQEKDLLNQQIKALKKDLELNQSNIETQTERIELTIKQLSETHAIQMNKQLEQQEKVFKAESQNLKVCYQKKITQFKGQLYQYQMKNKAIKQQIRLQFNKQVEAIKQRYQKLIKEKDEESLKRIQKAAQKVKEYENKLATSKKQSDQRLLNLQRQRTNLQRQIEGLKSKLHGSELELKIGLEDRKQAAEEMKLMESNLTSLKETISNKNKELQQLRSHQTNIENEVYKLATKRNNWVDELKQLENQYKRQFQVLKTTFQKQLNIYKSKVWELQGHYKKQYMSRKNYEKLQSLYSQKQELQNALQIKEAENIVLSQVKNFYQSQIEMKDANVTASEHKGPKTYFTRKIDRHRKYTEKRDERAYSNHTDSKQVVQMKKYIKQSHKKQVYLSLAKSRYNEVLSFERVNTNPV